MWQLGKEIRATPEEAPERTYLTRDARTDFFAEPLIQRGIRLTHLLRDVGKDRQRRLSQDSNPSPDFPLLRRLTITISVIEGPSKGLVYEMAAGPTPGDLAS